MSSRWVTFVVHRLPVNHQLPEVQQARWRPIRPMEVWKTVAASSVLLCVREHVYSHNEISFFKKIKVVEKIDRSTGSVQDDDDDNWLLLPPHSRPQQVTWIKVDDAVPSHAVITGADLYIENLNKSYNGTYRCMAANSVGESSDDYILYVYGMATPLPGCLYAFPLGSAWPHISPPFNTLIALFFVKRQQTASYKSTAVKGKVKSVASDHLFKRNEGETFIFSREWLDFFSQPIFALRNSLVWSVETDDAWQFSSCADMWHHTHNNCLDGAVGFDFFFFFLLTKRYGVTLHSLIFTSAHLMTMRKTILRRLHQKQKKTQDKNKTAFI